MPDQAVALKNFNVVRVSEKGTRIVASTVIGASGGGGGGSALTVKEEGTSVDTAVSSINFVGGSQTATQTASGAVAVTSTAYYPGGTDVPVTDGGTGASTASGARTNLGLGTAAVADTTAFDAAGAADAKVSDTAYGAGWNGDTSHAPSKNAVYDKIETLSSGGVTSVDGNTGAVTAAQLLTSIKTVDGSGSGLDADLLDGQSSSAFATTAFAVAMAAAL